MKLPRVRLISRILFLVFTLFLLIYIFIIENQGSLRSSFNYSSTNKNIISGFFPQSRFKPIIKSDIQYSLQTDDILYFSTKLYKDFDRSKIKINFKNPYSDQDIYLGFQQNEGWNYFTKLIDSPLLNNLNWTIISDENTVLYQRHKTYTTVSQFLNNPPVSKVIGTYDYDPDLFLNSTRLDNYSPASELTQINIPLRGKIVFYVYLKNEPLNLTVTKQDLNWSEGEDPLIVSVYKNQKLLHQSVAPDDGVVEDSKISNSEQSTSINSSPYSYLEEGVYKIVLNASADVIIKSIVTNLHKIVFDGPLYPASNSDIYSSVVSKTYPTQIYTNAYELSFKTFHSPGLQTLTIGEYDIDLNKTEKEFKISDLSGLTSITFPKSDVITTTHSGYFSFSPDQFFSPRSVVLRPISDISDLDSIDYIVSSYKPNISETTFDISSAFLKNRNLTWIIMSPHLKEKGRDLEIKNIELELIKTKTICNQSSKILNPICNFINQK